jgi:lipopolysaccharide transport system permease protein
VSALPAEYQRWLLLSPLTFIIEQARDVIIWARTPDWTGWSVSFTAGIAIAWMGFWWFQRTRRGFADVL